MAYKPILCMDFDGVLHKYTTKWTNAWTIYDGPVDGAMEFLREATGEFRVAIYSSRSEVQAGIESMQAWTLHHLQNRLGLEEAAVVFAKLEWPTTKPPASVSLDDRAITFNGVFPPVKVLKDFKPWNKR